MAVFIVELHSEGPKIEAQFLTILFQQGINSKILWLSHEVKHRNWVTDCAVEIRQWTPKKQGVSGDSYMNPLREKQIASVMYPVFYEKWARIKAFAIFRPSRLMRFQ